MTQITGHRTEGVYRRYAIVSGSDLQAASARLARHTGRHDPPARQTGVRYVVKFMAHPRGASEPHVGTYDPWALPGS
jgi:hypothetical protein